MTRLLSGSTLRRGGSGQFIDLAGAQPQLPPTDTTATGFTLITRSDLITEYRSSLGFIEFATATMYSSLPQGTIRIAASGTAYLSTTTSTGVLVVQGGIGVGGNMTIAHDINVNGLTLGQGYQGTNNIVLRGTANTNTSVLENGQSSIAIGYDVLTGLLTANKNIAIGRKALSSGSNISNTIAIGDSALSRVGTNNNPIIANISNVTIVPSTSVTNITTSTPIQITANGHGLSSGTKIILQGVIGLATSTGASSVINDTSFWIWEIDANNFYLYNNRALTIPSIGSTTTFNGSIVSLTNYVSGGTVISPVQLTVSTFINTGTEIFVDGIGGTTQLNNRNFYVDNINSTTIYLYNNSILDQPENSTGYTTYTSSGTIFRYTYNDNNLAIGINSAPLLENGASNFFFGNNLVSSLVTGSNNTFIGHNVGANLTNVNGTIALGGDNLVDNRNNQINIGSVFYYDGAGNTDINSDVRLGLGTASTGTDTGALVVVGGLAVKDKVYSFGSGQPDENYELYTPKISINTGTSPPNARVGDIWIDASVPAFLQYVRDGTDTYWIQVGSI